MEVMTADKCLAHRKNMINIEVVSRNSSIAKIVQKGLENFPDVVSTYMSLRKKSPKQLLKSVYANLEFNP